MNISDEGLRLIKSFEGYHTRLKDGSCTAYQTYLGKDRYGRKKYDIPTIGYGCTEGIKMGMVWTEAEAEAGLRREIAKFESAVNRLVTVTINSNEFDSMVSLAYNIGIGNFQKSTVLKRLNKGDRAGAAQAFHLFNKAQGIVLKGLVSRRAREAAMFLKPVSQPEEPFMPQSVEASRPPLPAPVVATGACSAGLAIPFIPTPPMDMVSNVAGWQSSAETVSAFINSPVMTYAIAGMIGYALICWLLPGIAARESA